MTLVSLLLYLLGVLNCEPTLPDSVVLSILQTYGGKNLKQVGVILQKSSLILLLFCLPCWGILINSYNLLLLLHQEDEVAR